jgi:hypothetical protein
VGNLLEQHDFIRFTSVMCELSNFGTIFATRVCGNGSRVLSPGRKAAPGEKIEMARPLVDGDPLQTPGHPAFERKQAQELAQKREADEAAAKSNFDNAVGDAKTKTKKYRDAARKGGSKAEVKRLKDEAIAAWNAALGYLPDYLRLVGVTAEAGKEKQAIVNEIGRLKSGFKGPDREIFNQVVDIAGGLVTGEVTLGGRQKLEAMLDVSAAGLTFEEARSNYEKARDNYDRALALPPMPRKECPEIVGQAWRALKDAEKALEAATTGFIEEAIEAELEGVPRQANGKYTPEQYLKAADAVKLKFGQNGQLALLIDATALGMALGLGQPADVATTLNTQLGIEIKIFGDKTSYTEDEWKKAGDNVKAKYQGFGTEQITLLVDGLVYSKINQLKIDDLAAKIKRGDVADLNLSPEELEFGKKNSHYLAVLLVGNVRFGTFGQGTQPITLTPEMKSLSETDPESFTVLMLSGITIDRIANDTLVLRTSDGRTRFLTSQELEVFGKGNDNKAGERNLANYLALQLIGALPGDPFDGMKHNTTTPTAPFVLPDAVPGPSIPLSAEQRDALLAAGDIVRIQAVKTEMGLRMTGPTIDEDAAMKFLKENMAACFSDISAQLMWEQAGAPYFTPQWAERKVKGFNGDTDAMGRWMKDMFANAPLQVVPVVFGALKAHFPQSGYSSNTNFKEFWDGLSKGVELLPPEEAKRMAIDIAQWLIKVGDGDLIRAWHTTGPGEAYNSPILVSVREGNGYTLARALLDEMLKTDNFQAMAQEIGTALPSAEESGDYENLHAANAEVVADFKKNKNENLNNYFDKFLNDPLVTTPLKLSDSNTPRFRNALGRAMGLTPNQNQEAAAAGNADVDWYARNSREGKIINDVLIPWMLDQGDKDSVITPVPMFYVSSRDGLKQGALFRISRDPNLGDTQVPIDIIDTAFRGEKQFDPLIDGKAAIDVVDMALGNPLTADDDKKIKPHAETEGDTIDPFDVPFNWKYKNFNDFQNENHYDGDGQIYIPTHMQIADRNGDGHVDWVERDAGRFSLREGLELAGDFAAAAAAVGAIFVTGGLATPLIVAALAWGGIRLAGEGVDMAQHGQTLSWSNPNARMLYVNAALLGLGGSSLALRQLSQTLKIVQTLDGASAAIPRVSRLPGALRAARMPSTPGFYGGAATTTGVAAMGGGAGMTLYQANDVVKNWRHMSLDDLVPALSGIFLGTIDIASGFMGARGNPDSEISSRWIEHTRRRALPGGPGLTGTDIVPASGGGTPVRYVAHFDADGAPSLGLLGADGRTTADLNAPWMENNPPSEVMVLETVTNPNGQVLTDAVHRLTRNADGTYSGTRTSADGQTTTYVTGGNGTTHPLAGIQLRNVARAWGDSYSRTAADGDPRPDTGGGDQGAAIVPLRYGHGAGAHRHSFAGGQENPAIGGRPPIWLPNGIPPRGIAADDPITMNSDGDTSVEIRRGALRGPAYRRGSQYIVDTYPAAHALREGLPQPGVGDTLRDPTTHLPGAYHQTATHPNSIRNALERALSNAEEQALDALPIETGRGAVYVYEVRPDTYSLPNTSQPAHLYGLPDDFQFMTLRIPGKGLFRHPK